MDLYAYTQVDRLEELAKANEIDIPRLRGYRLMSEEEPINKEEYDYAFRHAAVDAAKDLITGEPFWSSNPEWYTSDSWTDYLKKYYLVKNSEDDYYDIRWDRIHGWKRRVLKFEIKKAKRAIKKQYDMWNKYAGQEGVLYIHSRMGGNNWKYWDLEKRVALQNQPWFLDRVDDHWDSTYCDFYAKVDTSMREVKNNAVD